MTAPLPLDHDASEPWWVWRWDYAFTHGADLHMPIRSIKRWRKGWMTFYRVEMLGDVQWWIYLPLNLRVGFGFRGLELKGER